MESHKGELYWSGCGHDRCGQHYPGVFIGGAGFDGRSRIKARHGIAMADHAEVIEACDGAWQWRVAKDVHYDWLP